jgi:hypothetical protein
MRSMTQGRSRPFSAEGGQNRRMSARPRPIGEPSRCSNEIGRPPRGFDGNPARRGDQPWLYYTSPLSPEPACVDQVSKALLRQRLQLLTLPRGPRGGSSAARGGPALEQNVLAMSRSNSLQPSPAAYAADPPEGRVKTQARGACDLCSTTSPKGRVKTQARWARDLCSVCQSALHRGKRGGGGFGQAAVIPRRDGTTDQSRTRTRVSIRPGESPRRRGTASACTYSHNSSPSLYVFFSAARSQHGSNKAL